MTKTRNHQHTGWEAAFVGFIYPRKKYEKCCKGWLDTSVTVSWSCLLLKPWPGHQGPYQALQETSIQYQRKPTFLLTESCCSSRRFWSLLNCFHAVQVECSPSEQRRCFCAEPCTVWSWCGGPQPSTSTGSEKKMVSAGAVAWLGQICLEITTPNPRAIQAPKETGKRGHVEGDKICSATALLQGTKWFLTGQHNPEFTLGPGRPAPDVSAGSGNTNTRRNESWSCFKTRFSFQSQAALLCCCVGSKHSHLSTPGTDAFQGIDSSLYSLFLGHLDSTKKKQCFSVMDYSRSRMLK